MDDAIEAFQVEGIDLTSVRIPPHFTRAGVGPNEARDVMSTIDKARGHCGPDYAVGTSDQNVHSFSVPRNISSTVDVRL
jgi:hypothetical protein